MNWAVEVAAAVVLLTVPGLAGASLGAAMAGRLMPFRHVVPFGAGLLAGMAVFLVLPEAVGELNPAVALLGCAAGFMLFAVLENLLHRVLHDPHGRMIGLLPLIVAAGLHNILDGWNIAISAAVPDQSRLLVLLLGMGLHKFTGGLTLGAVFRAGTPSQQWATGWAVFAEALTLAGGFAQLQVRSFTSEPWLASLTAVSAGSFLYLGWHSFRGARAREGGVAARNSAVLGAVAVAAVTLLS